MPELLNITLANPEAVVKQGYRNFCGAYGLQITDLCMIEVMRELSCWLQIPPLSVQLQS